MATKKLVIDKSAFGYAPVKWKGHTFKVIGTVDDGMLCAGPASSNLPAPVYFIPTDEMKQ